MCGPGAQSVGSGRRRFAISRASADDKRFAPQKKPVNLTGWINGAGNGIRTRDLLHGKQML